MPRFFAADGYGLASQARIRRLLDGGEEGIGIQMDDGARDRHAETRLME